MDMGIGMGSRSGERHHDRRDFPAPAAEHPPLRTRAEPPWAPPPQPQPPPPPVHGYYFGEIPTQHRAVLQEIWEGLGYIWTDLSDFAVDRISEGIQQHGIFRIMAAINAMPRYPLAYNPSGLLCKRIGSLR